MLPESELDRRLHDSNPIDAAALDNEGVRAALVAVRRSLESEAWRQTPSRSPKRAGYRRRWVTLGAAVATAGAASLVGVATLAGGVGGAGLPLAVTPAAAAQLGRVARAAAAQVTPGPNQLEYEAIEIETSADPSVGGTRVNFTYDQTEQNWLGRTPIDEGRQRMTTTGIAFPSAVDRANYLANKSVLDSQFGDLLGTKDLTATGVLNDVVFPAHGRSQEGNLTPIQREVFDGTERPSGPKALLAELAAATDSEPTELWGGLVTILRESTDAQLRATAYHALAYVRGTTILGDRTDQLGRVGTAIQFIDRADGWTQTIIVSPATGYMLQEDDSGNNKAQRSVYLQRGIVNSVTALPGGGSQPFTAATRTLDLATGTATPTLQTTSSASQTTTAGAQTSTAGARTSSTTSTSQTSTDPQATTSTPQSR